VQRVKKGKETDVIDHGMSSLTNSMHCLIYVRHSNKVQVYVIRIKLVFFIDIDKMQVLTKNTSHPLKMMQIWAHILMKMASY
jgi:hypothetical protein